MPEFYGKYRGKVANNIDPNRLGRLQVEVPAVLGMGRLNWAMPCVPYAGMQVGFYALPSPGANVWVEFEAGDPDYPIWSGCFWGVGELPALASTPEVKLFKTETMSVAMSAALGFRIEVLPPVVPQPLTLQMNAQGIEIRNGTLATAKLGADSVELVHSSKTTVRLSPTDVELINPPLQARLTSAGNKIELSNGVSTVVVASDQVQVMQGKAIIKVAATGIEIVANPRLGSIKLLPAGVNINNGALEVT